MCKFADMKNWAILIENQSGESLLTSEDGSIASFSGFEEAEAYRCELLLSNVENHEDRTQAFIPVQLSVFDSSLIVRNELGSVIHTLNWPCATLSQ